MKKFNLGGTAFTLLAIWIAAGSFVFPRMSVAAATATNAEAVKGRQLFEKRCTGCHSLERNKEGPRLAGVYGRRAGSVGDFNYSDSLKGANFVWDEAHLDQWLANPEALVADNDMAFHVSSGEERAAIIQFLRATSGK